MQPIVQILDDSGLLIASGPMAALPVTASLSEGSGTLTGTTTVNAAAGVATFADLQIAGFGPHKLKFSIASPSLDVASTSFAVSGGAPASLAVTSQPINAVSGLTLPPLRVGVRDVDGNPTASSDSISVAIASGSGTLGGLTKVAADAGVATFAFLIISGAGPHTLAFSGLPTPSIAPGAGSAAISPVESAAITVGQAAAALSMETQPGGAISGLAFGTPPVIRVVDNAGLLMPTATNLVTASLVSGTGTMLGTATATAVNGRAVFSDLRIVGSGTHRLQFSTTALTPTSSATFSVSLTGSPATTLLTVTQPSPTSPNGVALSVQPAVQLRDANGDPVAQAGVVVSAAIGSGGGQLGGSVTATTNVNGIATFAGLTIAGTIGPRALTFTTTGVSAATSDAINLVAGAPAKLAIATQPSTSAPSGMPLAQQPAIQVRDVSGNDASQVVVITAAIQTGGGSLGGAVTATTDFSGRASFADLSVSGTVGQRTLTFTAPGLTSITSGSLAVTPGAPQQLSVAAQPSASAQNALPFPQQPSIQLRDAANNASTQAGVVITAALASGGGSLQGISSVTTNASGVAVFGDLRILGAVGTRTISFSTPGMGSVFSSPVSISAGAPDHLTIARQPATSAQSGLPLATQPIIQLLDVSGNPAAQPGVAVTAAVATGSGVLTGLTTVTTDATGAANFADLTVTSGTSGVNTLSFASGSLGGTTSGGITTTTASKIAMVAQPSGAAQNNMALSQQPSVRLFDVADQPIAQDGIVISAFIVSGGGALGGTTTATTDASGTATFTNLMITGTVGDRVLGFSSASLTTATSNAITVGAGTPTQLTITSQPSPSAQNGVSFATQPGIQLRDVSNNLVGQAGVVVTASISSGGPAIGGTLTATTDGSGLAAFTNLSVTGTTGARTIGFSATGLAGIASSPVTVTVGAATKVTVTVQPSPLTLNGSPFAQQPVIQLRDVSNNVVTQTGIDVTAAIASGGGTLSGAATTATDASGVATFTDLAITGAGGDRTLTFSAASLASTTSSTISVTTATQLLIVTQPSASAQSGSVFPTQPSVQLADGVGAPVAQSGVAVTVAILAGPGTLSGSMTVNTDASGVASFSALMITGVADLRTLTFSAPSVSSATSSSITVGAGSATKLSITTQPSASAANGVAFSVQPVIQLRDVSNNAVSQEGVVITAALASGGGTFGGTLTATTNASGAATFANLSITGTTGARTVSFSAASLASITSGNVSLTVGPATKVSVSTQPSSTAASGVAFATQPIAQLRDVSNQNVSQSGILVSVGIGTGTGTIGGTTGVLTSGSGASSFAAAGLNITGCGPHTLQFTSSGLTSAPSNTVTVTGAASKLSITTQPSATAQTAAPFATQPVIQLRDACNNAVAQSGIVVTAAIASGGGAIGGTVTATTNTGGVASFTNLSITGPDGARTLTFTSGSLTAVMSGSITIGSVAPPVVGTTNEPSNFQLISERNFLAKEENSWLDRGDAAFSIQDDATAPKSDKKVGQALFPAGFGAGSGPINTYINLPGNFKQIYMGVWLKFSSNFEGHPNSGVNKIIFIWIDANANTFLNAQGQGAGILTPSINLQNNVGGAVRLSPNITPGASFTRGVWHFWEVLMVANTVGQTNGSVRWWLDGVEIGNYTNVGPAKNSSNRWEIVSWNPTWGGAGGVVTANMTQQIDYIRVSGLP